MKIAFFDFDGTITKEDSTIKFIRFFSGDLKYIIGIIVLSPLLILYKLNILSNNYIKRIIITYFFKGISEVYFKNQVKKKIKYKLIIMGKNVKKLLKSLAPQLSKLMSNILLIY